MGGGGWGVTRAGGHRTDIQKAGLDFPSRNPTERLVRGVLSGKGTASSPCFMVLWQSPVAEVVECGPLAFLAFPILQQGENQSGHQCLVKGSKVGETPLSGQVRTGRMLTKRERMTLAVPPEAGGWPTSGSRGSGLLDEKKPIGKGRMNGRLATVADVEGIRTPMEQAGGRETLADYIG